MDFLKIGVAERAVVGVPHAVGGQHERHRAAVVAITGRGFDLLLVCCHGDTITREIRINPAETYRGKIISRCRARAPARVEKFTKAPLRQNDEVPRLCITLMAKV